jgi:hypothetical protein
MIRLSLCESLFGLPLANLDGVEGSTQNDQKYGGSDDDAY